MKCRRLYAEDTKVGIIGNFLETTDEDYVCSSMIYELAFHHENEEPKPYESKEIGSIMRNEFSNDWEQISSHRFENMELKEDGRENILMNLWK